MTKYGNDFLGGCFFEKEAIKASIKGDVFGILPETFNKGDSKKGWATVEAFCKSGKFSEGVVHLTPFDRTHKYPIDKLKPLIKKNLLQLKTLQSKYPGIVLMPSVFCEHTHSRKDLIPLFQFCRTLWADAQYVNSIIGAGQSVPGVITELHIESSHTLPKEPLEEYILSFDGFGSNKKFTGNMVDMDYQLILAKFPKARHIRAWMPRYNGKFNALQDSPPEPNKRTCWPSVDYIRGARLSMRIREGNVTYPKSALLKTFADDHGKGDWKDSKMLVIIPKGGDKAADVYDSKNNKIDSMKRVTPDHNNDPKGRRYYSNKYAVQIADIAMKNTGSSLVTIKSGAVTLPPTDCYLRSNLFR